MMMMIVMVVVFSAVFAPLSEGVTWEENAVRLEIQGTEFLVAINCPGNVIGSRRTWTFFHPSACRTVREVGRKMH